MSSPLDAPTSASLEHLPVAVARLGSDGRIVWANARCCALLRRPVEELVGIRASVLCESEDRPEVVRRSQDLRRSPADPVLFDVRLRRGDGTTTWAQVSASTAPPSARGEDAGEVLAVLAEVASPQRELERARVSDRRFRLLMEASPNSVVCVDEQGVIQIANPAALRMFGYAHDELVGQHVEELIPARFRPGHEHVRGRYGTHPDQRPMGAGRDLFALRKDGTEFPVEISLGPAKLDDGLLVQTQVVDITDRKRAEDELRRRAVQQAAIARLGERALEGVAVKELFSRAVELVAEALDVPLVKVLELDPADDCFVLRAAVGWPAESIDVARVALRDTQAGAALQSERPVVVDDLDRHPDLYPGGLLRRQGIVGGASATIGSAQNPVGVLGAHTTRPRTFTREDLDFLQAAANILADAIARRRAESHIRHQALHDPLTGLANRDLLLHHVTRALAEEPRRPERRAAVVFIDLDHFKTVNDSLGHDAGDALLRGVARRLVDAVRPGDVVARFGGDEFVVLCEALAGPDDAAVVVDRIVRALADPFDLGRARHTVTASIGVALSGEQAADAHALLRNADAAMYRAKGSGRARYELFSDEMHEHALRRLRLEGALRHAADRSELTLLYQPIVVLGSGQLAGFEALVRWRRRGELIGPADFIPVAEETGVIRAIGAQVLRDACVQAAAWQELRPLHAGAAVSVNLSPRQLADPQLVAAVGRALQDSGADPGRLRLELTETALMADHRAAIRTCKELTALGVGLVLDDFGTGFSSLSHLGRYPIDTVKIDRSFVADLTADAGARGIVAAVLTMAGGFGARVVAEGVERPEQARVLQEMGCELAQGFLFSLPCRSTRRGRGSTRAPRSPRPDAHPDGCRRGAAGVRPPTAGSARESAPAASTNAKEPHRHASRPCHW